MRITEEMDGGTVGQLAAFLAHALENGVSLGDKLTMSRDRKSSIVQIAIDVRLPGFENSAVAAAALQPTEDRRRRTRVTATGAPDAAPPAE